MNTDRALISGIINGDERILKVFYRDNVRYVQGYILANTGTMEDVEDIFQDALVVLYQKLKYDTIELGVPVKTYFYGICKNTWRNRLRKKHKLIIDGTILQNKEILIDSAANNIENNEREHLYRKHFQKLSNDTKNLMLLYFEGKSAKEISQITGYTEGYTRKKKFEAKKQLMTMIEKDPLYDELRITA